MHNVSMRVKIPKNCLVESECVILTLLYYIKPLSTASMGKTYELKKKNFLDKTVLLSENLRPYTLLINIMVPILVYSFLVYKVIIKLKT